MLYKFVCLLLTRSCLAVEFGKYPDLMQLKTLSCFCNFIFAACEFTLLFSFVVIEFLDDEIFLFSSAYPSPVRIQKEERWTTDSSSSSRREKKDGYKKELVERGGK